MKASAAGIAIILLMGITACQNKTQKMENELKTFLSAWETKAKPLQKDANIAYWNAALSGKDEDYKKSEELQNQLVKIYASKDDFAKLKKIIKRESGVLILT